MKKVVIILSLILTLVLQGCSSKEKDDQASKVTDAKNITVTAAPTIKPTAVPEIKSDLVLPLTVNDTGKVLIQTVSKSFAYPNNSYIITSAEGESIIVDPTEMPAKSIVDINPAAILSTHSHGDHVDALYTGSYDVPKLLYEDGKIKTKDFNIYSVPSSHNGDKIDNTNYIMVIEVDGLRIAHMGDIGQNKLTEKQLKKIGKIDIAFMQFDNSYSSMSAGNKKGFNLIEQLNPKIVITTHSSNLADLKIKEKYGDLTHVDNMLEISKDDLPDTFLNVYKIENKHKYQ